MLYIGTIDKLAYQLSDNDIKIHEVLIKLELLMIVLNNTSKIQNSVTNIETTKLDNTTHNKEMIKYPNNKSKKG